jgi:hypothetical protein
MTGAEQLFNLTADRYEMVDLAAGTPSPGIQSLLATWRGRMADQWQAEGRGDAWVKDGVLQRRVEGLLYSPNYPA